MTEASQLDLQKIPSIHEDSPIAKLALAKKLLPIGFITFGGPMSHIGVFRKIFIDDMQCISNDKFTELLSLCQSLPGPTSTQLVIALSMYATCSWIGGLLAFIIFSLPTFIVMTFSALIMNRVNDLESVEMILAGFRIISVAIILQAFWNLSQKYRKEVRMTFLFLISTVVYFYSQSSLTILILFLLGGIYNLLTENNQSDQSEQVFTERFSSCPYGIKNIVLFIAGLIFAFYITQSSSSQSLSPLAIIWATFYKIGSLVIGGGHVILPLMWTEFSTYNYFTEEAYWNGFSIISCMPGPMFNLSVYIGTISVNSILGGFSAFLGLYIPCFLFVSLALPLWEKYRKGSWIRVFLAGVCCVSVGLILATCIILYLKVTVESELGLPYSILIMVSFLLLYNKFKIVTVLVIGQLAYLAILGIASLI